MPGPGAYGNKVPPNMKKIRRVATKYGRISARHHSELNPQKIASPNHAGKVRRSVIKSILDRGPKGNDGIPWQRELRTARKNMRQIQRRTQQIAKSKPRR